MQFKEKATRSDGKISNIANANSCTVTSDLNMNEVKEKKRSNEEPLYSKKEVQGQFCQNAVRMRELQKKKDRGMY